MPVPSNWISAAQHQFLGNASDQRTSAYALVNAFCMDISSEWDGLFRRTSPERCTANTQMYSAWIKVLQYSARKLPALLIDTLMPFHACGTLYCRCQKWLEPTSSCCFTASVTHLAGKTVPQPSFFIRRQAISCSGQDVTSPGCVLTALLIGVLCGFHASWPFPASNQAASKCSVDLPSSHCSPVIMCVYRMHLCCRDRRNTRSISAYPPSCI